MLNPFKKNSRDFNSKFPDKPVRPITLICEKLCPSPKEKRSGRALLVCCPLHGENNPSCALYDDNNTFYCFSCHEQGDYITFVQKVMSVDFKEALSIIERL